MGTAKSLTKTSRLTPAIVSQSVKGSAPVMTVPSLCQLAGAVQDLSPGCKGRLKGHGVHGGEGLGVGGLGAGTAQLQSQRVGLGGSSAGPAGAGMGRVWASKARRWLHAPCSPPSWARGLTQAL